MSPEIQEIPQPSMNRGPILLMTATLWEAAPLVRALGLASDCKDRFFGQVKGRSIILVRTGIGAAAAASALEKDFIAGNFGLLMSVGLCGALQPELKNGDLVADPHEADLELALSLRETAGRLNIPLHFGRILHTNIVLQPEKKRKLGSEQRAVACDMETAALRRWAHESSVPVIGLRAVLDELNESLPSETPKGERTADLARYAWSHAAQIPMLIRTGLRSKRAMRSLSHFLKAYLEVL